MKMNVFKKAAVLGMGGLGMVMSSCANPSVPPPQTAHHYRQVTQLAVLISEEIPPRTWESETEASLEISRTVVRLSRTYRIDPLLVLSIIKVESQFRPMVTSRAGAIGLMQVMPIVVRHIGSEVDVRRKEDLFDPEKNILIGLHYFTYLRDKYENNLLNALAAYNMGPTALDGRLSRRGSVPTTYYRKVMSCYETFRRRLFAYRWRWIPEMT